MLASKAPTTLASSARDEVAHHMRALLSTSWMDIKHTWQLMCRNPSFTSILGFIRAR